MSLIRSIYHYLLAFLSHLAYGFPSRKLTVVGVTGTKGKSTVVDLLGTIFEMAGKKTAVLSTVRVKIPGRDVPNRTGNTMPGRFFIARFLREAVRAGASHAFLEVTSQGVLQHRERFIEWDGAVFLNLAPEHIESHGSFEAYRDAKVRFFRSLRHSSKRERRFFINDDDPNAPSFASAARDVPESECTRFSRGRLFQEAAAHGMGLILKQNRAWLGEWLVPEFNVGNAAAAACVAERYGISWETIVEAFKKFRGVPGRMEFVQRKPFSVVVDYAHTPDSFEQVLKALRDSFVGEQDGLICVFGAASGGRDVWKRPIMGKIAAELCDAIVLTSEDPFDEDPAAIIAHIEKGFSEATPRRLPPDQIWKIPDRRQAIRKALTLAKEGDVVVMTGKGTETSIRVARGKKIPWNEREVAEEELAALAAEKKPVI
ncbi:MAG: UDP-N-acetylmuramoyl-L-alanyl-D-glutamate--2,6-diaminopimelate ligase [Patescibacteria group bacterium]